MSRSSPEQEIPKQNNAKSGYSTERTTPLSTPFTTPFTITIGYKHA